MADVAYTYGYYQELNPLRLKLAFLHQGLVLPEIGAACELGFGQGLSANIHAAASLTQWHGTDFNPAQAGFAQDLAAASATGAQLYDEGFAEFCTRPDLPDFDYIGLHGIWSWISDENRQVIVDFVRKKLKVGGVLYISYNTLPGWASFAPMRHLMTEHAEVLGSEGRGILSRVDGAIDFVEKLMATNPAFSHANPLVSDRLKQMKTLNRHYVAHEYFNRDWHPMHFATMAKWLEPAKVQFACSANYFDAVEAINLSAEQQAFLAEIPDAMFRQSARDFMVNQQFRKDYWVKGARKMSALDQAEALRKQSLVLTTPRADVALKVTGAMGEATLQEAVYGPILDLLSDHKVRSIGDMAVVLKDKEMSFGQMLQAVMLLTGGGHVHAVQAVSPQMAKTTTALNAHLMQQSRGSKEVSYLASPITGGGHTISRFQQLFLLAIKNGHKTPQDWAKFTWQVLAAQNQKLVKKGKTLETAEENTAELTSEAVTFAEKQLPILEALQIA